MTDGQQYFIIVGTKVESKDTSSLETIVVIAIIIAMTDTLLRK